jgi:hypothetical protein
MKISQDTQCPLLLLAIRKPSNLLKEKKMFKKKINC